MTTATKVTKALREQATKENAVVFQRFFKTGKGQYGEGDQFLGVKVPNQRKVAREFTELPLVEIGKLLKSKWHECRLTGIFILVRQFEKAKKSEADRKQFFDFYIHNLDRVNNWDLVDSSAYKIAGAYLENRSRDPLYRLAKANHLWKNRVAMVATMWFIKRDDYPDTIALAKILLHHEHDLIHKAVGWMLREMGQGNEGLLLGFLDEHAAEMPRTALRYAIEKLDPSVRKAYLAQK